jgi:hypothetical protein
MPSSKYHREQARVLAGLALSTNDEAQADRFKLAVMQHLERADALDDADQAPPPLPKPNTDEYADLD